ncbi:MAG: cupin domain-containing protein [SAR324 cluster bacterium]
MFNGLQRGHSLSTLALVAIGCLAAGWIAGTAMGEMTPPGTDHGITRQRGPEVDLAPELPGYKLHMTAVTFEPGAVRAIHEHHNSPEVTYIVQGKLTEFRKDGSVKEFGPGDMRANGREVEHWLENRGTSTMVQVVASVVKSK